jgi:hypothetical protein
MNLDRVRELVVKARGLIAEAGATPALHAAVDLLFEAEDEMAEHELFGDDEPAPYPVPGDES